jgi:hypothetical protein
VLLSVTATVSGWYEEKLMTEIEDKIAEGIRAHHELTVRAAQLEGDLADAQALDLQLSILFFHGHVNA